MNEDLTGLERIIGYNFKDKSLLDQALTHRSYATEHSGMVSDNERLEFLGDAVLELVMTKLLFDLYGKEYSEGDLTRMRAFLVNENQLASQAQRLTIGEFIKLGKGEERSGGRYKKSILADTFEAITGAIYLDGGLDPCFKFIKSIYDELLKNVTSQFKIDDYKSALQELTQAKFHVVPTYRVERISGPDHNRSFEVALIFEGDVLARGKGSSKKKAEQEAAKKALKILKDG
ncbi:Ribonuclease III [Dissulfuribacter thermophilus]|uniref:Ribonuclease 3 n=1 Tax=Dissulfuribacter thermophilus TaxID=1156395 RepID=A0A1B9F642_9BACT|nr:ribonuclease III [Dissulfuribacter thermophilus]OCC15386.1 Ribonuclease III [Dissulfuribacter thermophilus]